MQRGGIDFLKWRRQHIDMGQAIAMNYVMATALTWAYLKPNVGALNTGTSAIALFVALGILLPSVFLIMSKSGGLRGHCEIGRGAAFITVHPDRLGAAVFGEQLTQARGLGIVWLCRLVVFVVQTFGRRRAWQRTTNRFATARRVARLRRD